MAATALRRNGRSVGRTRFPAALTVYRLPCVQTSRRREQAAVARAFDRWAALDPIGVMPRVVRVARVLPGVGLAERGADAIERQALRALRQGLDALALPAGAPAPAQAPAAPVPEPAVAGPGPLAARDGLTQLLDRAVHESTDQSRQALFDAIVGALVPDEARILAALADGHRYALIHVAEPGGRRVLENASSVGRAAGVALIDRVPLYVTRLLGMDLIVEGPGDNALKDDYAVLLTDGPVRAAREQAAGRRPAKVLRRTLSISPLGRELWEACRP